ncbi:MAG TPA: GTP cyclohydrolase II [Anaeromyxobacteraceae bacterium]|nr:GTP cyclohydrolase II [Anaeromyxobacteraceae bacterium]
MTEGTDALRDLVVRDREHECEGYGAAKVCVRIVAVARLPTRFGDFRLVGFWNNRDGKEHVAMVHGDVVGAEDVAVRLHSECLTGDVMGSLRCDCRDQLAEGLRAIQREGRGVLLYLRQEGRGIGLLNKIRAYALQEQGLDTVEANQALGFRDDERDYAVAAHMVKSLGLRSVRVITNNPDKMAQLTRHGVVVSGRIPHVIPPNEHNRFYLETKAARSGHLIDIVRERLPEQSDPVIVDGMPPR